MSRNHQFIHLFSFVALIASLFSPVLTLPVTAEDLPPEPEVTLLEGGEGTPVEEVDDDTPAAPELIRVTPQPAIITEAVCADGTHTSQTASVPVSEGISYDISGTDANGNFTITATLIDSSIYAWSETGLDGWIVDGDSATQSGTLTLCPVSEPVDKETVDNDIPKPEGEPEEADAAGEPTIGRGPARETTMARGMDMQASSTGMSISMTSDKTLEIMPGDQITYTVTVNNNTGMDQHYALQHVLPQGFVFDSSTEPYPQMGDYCGVEAGTITCGLADGMVLYPGWSDVWTITVTLDIAWGQFCVSGITHTVTGSWTDNNEASITTYFSQQVCGTLVSIFMTPDTQTIDQYDQEISLTVSLGNHGTDAYGSEVDIPLPEWLRLDGWTATVSGGYGVCTYTAPAESLHCSDLTVPASEDGTAGLQTITWTLPAQAEYPAEACGDHTLTATFTRGIANASNQANVTISCQPLLTLSQTVSPVSGSTDTEFEFIITVTNIGYGTESEYQLFFSGPTDSVITDWPTGQEVDPNSCITYADLGIFHLGECRGVDLSAGYSQTFEYTLTLPEDHFPADSCQELSTLVSGTTAFGAWDAAAQAGVNTTFYANCGMMSISNTFPASVEFNDPFTSEIRAYNAGSTSYTGAFSIKAELPSGFVLTPGSQAFFEQQCPDSTLSGPGSVIIRCGVSSNTFDQGGDVVWGFEIVAEPALGAVCGEVSSTVTGVDGTWNPDAQTHTATTFVVGEGCENQFLVEQSASVDVALPGMVIDYTYTITNLGTDTKHFEMLSHAPPGSYTLSWLEIPAGADCWTYPDYFYATCDDIFIEPGHTFVAVLRTIVDESATSEMCQNHLTNKLELWVPGESESREYFLTTPLNCQQLSIAKSVSADEVNIGDPFTYTVSVENNGLNDTGSYAFTDELPSGIQLVDDNSISQPAGEGITCNPQRSQGLTTINCASENGPPAEGGTHEYTFTMRANDELDNDVCGEITNAVTGTTGQWEIDSAAVDTFINCPSLVLTKSVDKATVNPGDVLTYTITVENIGAGSSDQYLFFDDLPPGALLTFDPAPLIADGANCITLQQGSDEFDCLHSGVTPDEPHVYEFSVKISDEPTYAMCEDGIINWAWGSGLGAWSEELPAEGVSATTQLNCIADIEITKSAPSTVNPGDSLEYTLTVANTGNIPITDVFIGEIMPLVGVSGWTVEAPDGITCEMVAALLACDSFSLPVTAEYTFTITGTTETDPGVLLCNVPYLNQALVGGLTVVGLVGDSSDLVSTNLNCVADITVTKTDNLAGAIEPGSTFTYEVTVENTGTLPLTDVVVNDPLPSGVSFESLVDDNGMSCDTSVRCTVSSLGAGESHTIQFEVRVNTNLTAAICEEGVANAVNASGRARTRLFRIQDNANETTPLDCITDLAFDKQPLNDADTVIPGETIGYEITLENTGSLDLTATINDDLPELPEGGEWAVTLGDFGITLPHTVTDLEPGSSITIRIESSVIPDDLTLPESEWCVSWENTATITGSFSNDDPVDASSDASVRVNCTDLSIVKEVSAPVIELGGQVEYTITVTNQGNTVVTPILVTDDINLTTTSFSNWEISAEGAVGCDSENTNGLFCLFEALGLGESVVVTITADALELPAWEQCAPVENTASFVYFYADAPTSMSLQTELSPPETFIPSNTVSTQLDCQPEIEITKNGEINPGADGRVDVGDTITYTFAVTNSGNVTLYDIVVVDDMEGLVWESDPTHKELLPEAAITFTATYEVTQTDIDNGEVVNTGVVTAYTSPSGDDASDVTLLQNEFEVRAVTANDTAITGLKSEPGIDLVKSSVAETGNDDVLNLGETIEYTFTIENTGNVTLTDLEVIDHMEGVVFDDGTTIARLGVSEVTELTASYTVTQADVDAGIIVNCADVTASGPDDTEVSDLNKCATDLVDQNPSLLIVQSCPGPSDDFLPDVGDEVTYLMTISNDGDQTVHAIAIVTSRDGTFEYAFPTSLAPGQTETREWTIIVTQDDYDAREVTVEVTVRGETDAGASATLTSMVAMQAESQVENTIMLTCPMGDLPEVPAKVIKLPETGHGGIVSAAPVLWAAAMLSTVMLGAAAVGVRSSR